MKKLVKILGLLLVCAIIGLIVFLKVLGNDKNIYISTGFSKNTMIKVDKQEVLSAQVYIELMDAKSEYEELFGADIWLEDINGKSFGEYVTDNIKTKLTRIQCMNVMAQKRGIVLSNAEEADVSKAAKEYMDSLSSDVIKKTGITQTIVEEMLRQYIIADRLFDDITDEVNTEVSEDEARVIIVQYIKADTVDEIDNIKARLDAGESFSSLIKIYNPEEYEYELRRGEIEQSFEEAAYSLAAGEVSDCVETSQGYYIIMCISDYEKAKTAVNMEEMVNKRKLEAFNAVLDEYEASVYAEYNEEAWDKLDVTTAPQVIRRFSVIYEQYFK